MDTSVKPEYDNDEVNCHAGLDPASRKTTNSLLLDTGVKHQYDKKELLQYDKKELHRYDNENSKQQKIIQNSIH